MPVITRQQLEDAAADAETLEQVLEGAASPGTVTTRQGTTYKNVRATLAEMLALAEPNTYATTAALNAALSSLTPGQFTYNQETEALGFVYDNSGTNAVQEYLTATQIEAVFNTRLTALEGDVGTDDGEGDLFTRVATLEGSSGSYSGLRAEYIAGLNQRQLLYASGSPLALILVLIGQSLTVPRGDVSVTGTAPENCFMPVGGIGLPDMAFFSLNVEHVSHWDEWASAVRMVEGNDRQSPVGGAALQLAGSNFDRIYGVSVGIGSRDHYTLGAGGPRCNMYAALQRMCQLARDAGYTPVVAGATAHAESSMNNGRSEADYYETGMRYYGMFQMAAAQAMGDPNYRAPIVFSHPQSNSYGQATLDVQKALLRLTKDIPNAINIGSSGVFGTGADRVHNTDQGQAHRGEIYGWALREFYEKGRRVAPVMISDCVINGTTATVILNTDTVDDSANYDYGENLNSSNAFLGFEWYDNGTAIEITNAVKNGYIWTLTLASAPTGTTEQQEVRLAVQATASTLVNGSNNRSGTPIRESGNGVPFISTPGETWHRFPVPQSSNVRSN